MSREGACSKMWGIKPFLPCNPLLDRFTQLWHYALARHFHFKLNEMLHSHPHQSTRVRVDTAGRVTLPADLRHKLGIEPGQELILAEDSQGIRLQTFDQAVRAAQEAFAPYRIPGQSIVDELIRERREEANREYDE